MVDIGQTPAETGRSPLPNERHVSFAGLLENHSPARYALCGAAQTPSRPKSNHPILNNLHVAIASISSEKTILSLATRSFKAQ